MQTYSRFTAVQSSNDQSEITGLIKLVAHAMFGPIGAVLQYLRSRGRGVLNPPVNRAIFPTSPPNCTSLGMKFFRLVAKHSVGCLSSSKSNHAESPSTSSGRQEGSPIAVEALARLKRQSSSANTLIARSQVARSMSNSAKRRNLKALMAVLRFSRASLSCRTLLCRDPTTYRVFACEPGG